MGEPEIAASGPAVLELGAGAYLWCRCGRSEDQPFCDGSHAGTDFSPVRLEIEETRRIALCQCKRTGRQPLCDGSHKAL